MLAPGRDPFAVRGSLAAGVRAFPVVPQLHGHVALGDASTSAAGDLTSALLQREIDVLRLVADGRTNREIGGALGLSALTVKSHLARIGRKLNTGDRAEMVAVTMRAGVIDRAQGSGRAS